MRLEGNHCRLYDENLVRNIMISTGLSILDYVKEHGSADAADICDYVEQNAETIIWNTIEDMNSNPDASPSEEENNADEPPLSDTGTDVK
jgi:hypothetical protein